MEKNFVILENRAVLRIEGPDARNFLQGIITNDITEVTRKKAIYALMLTPQGKFLFDLFIMEHDDELLWLDASKSRLEDLKKKLAMYKLRSQVNIEDISAEYKVAAIFSDEYKGREGEVASLPLGFGFIDPRIANLGVRAFMLGDEIEKLKIEGYEEKGMEFYEERRIRNVVPESDKELLPEKSFPLQNGLDDLNAISFTKGCYVGQEVTARSKHRGAIRKKLYAISIEGDAPQNGAVLRHEGLEVGEMRSSSGKVGLALLEIERAEKARQKILEADGNILRIIG